MKGSAAAAAVGGAAASSLKRHWKGLTVTVFSLFFCSLHVALSFLLGRFASGYVADERSSTDPGLGSYGREEHNAAEAGTDNGTREADGGKKACGEPIGDSPHIISSPKNSTSHSKPKDVVTNSKPKDVISHSKDVIVHSKESKQITGL